MYTRLALPSSIGTTQAPRISTSPGCIHSGVIVVFSAHEPRFPQKLRHDDDRDAGNQTVERAPAWQVLEPEVGLVPVETRRDDLADRDHGETYVEPAFHGITIPASFRSGAGYTPSNRLAIAVSTNGTTIHGTSRTSLRPESGSTSKYALYKTGPR